MPNLYIPLVALVAGFSSAALYVVGLGGSVWGVFLVLVSPLPIYVAGLKWGSLAAGAAGVFAVMATVVAGDLLLASVFSAAFAMPAFLLSHLATRPAGGDPAEPVWPDATRLTLALMAVGFLEVTLAALAVSTGEAGLPGVVRSNLSLLAESLYGARSSHGPDAVTDVVDIVDFWDSLVLGLIVAVVLTAHAAMGALAQGLVSNSATPLRPSPAFDRLRLPAWPSVTAALLAAAVLGLDALEGDRLGTAGFSIHVLTGFLLVLCVGFLLQGLAVLHALTRGMGARPFILAGAYMAVLVFQPFGAVAFAAVGFAERWAGFRERFGAGDDAATEG